MTRPLLELEGTWEEIAAHGAELAGRKVRLIVLPTQADPYPNTPPQERPSTGNTLLKYWGTWVGDDLEQCLQDVYANRAEARF